MSAAAAAVASRPSLCGALADALRLTMRGDAGTAAPLLPLDAESDAALSPPQLSARYAAALLALLPPRPAPGGAEGLGLGAGEVAQLLLAAHHPVLTGALRRKTAALQLVCGRVRDLTQALPGEGRVWRVWGVGVWRGVWRHVAVGA